MLAELNTANTFEAAPATSRINAVSTKLLPFFFTREIEVILRQTHSAEC